MFSDIPSMEIKVAVAIIRYSERNKDRLFFYVSSGLSLRSFRVAEGFWQMFSCSLI